MKVHLWILGTFALLSLVWLPSGAQACMTDDCQICWDFGCDTCTIHSIERTTCTDCGTQLQAFQPSRTTTVTFLDAERAEIIVPDFTTTQLQPTTSCIVAFAPVPGLASVDSVVNFNGETQKPFEEVTFHSSLIPGYEAAKLADHLDLPMSTDAPWFGFRSQITGTVEDGVPNHFAIRVRLDEGVTPREFLDSLQLHGMFLASSSDPNGVPTDHHNTFRRLGSGDIVVRLAEGLEPALLDPPQNEPSFTRLDD